MKLKYVYQGSNNYIADLAFYRDQLGAKKIWEFAAFGANVAALELEGQPLILLNDHSSETRLIYVVDNIETMLETLREKGLKLEGEAPTPTGTCHLFSSPSGSHFAIMQETRPNAMLEAFNAANPSARLE